MVIPEAERLLLAEPDVQVVGRERQRLGRKLSVTVWDEGD